MEISTSPATKPSFIRVIPAQSKGEFELFAKQAGIASNPDEVLAAWNTPERKPYSISGVSFDPYRIGPNDLRSVSDATGYLKSQGREALNVVEGIALLKSIRSGHSKLPKGCKGIHLLATRIRRGSIERILVLRPTKRGDWEFALTKSDRVDGFYFVSRLTTSVPSEDESQPLNGII